MRSVRDDAKNIVRQIAEEAVKRTEPQCGSRMLAYAKVAAVIGVSASWLRKFITVDGTPEPRWSAGFALIAHYELLCERVDNDITRQRKENLKMIGDLKSETASITGNLNGVVRLPRGLVRADQSEG